MAELLRKVAHVKSPRLSRRHRRHHHDHDHDHSSSLDQETNTQPSSNSASDLSSHTSSRASQRRRHQRSISDVTQNQFRDVEMDDADSHAFSDTELESRQPELPGKQGHVAKWTNYIHGWQDRFLVLDNGILSYYKSAKDKARVCRGSLEVRLASIRPHNFDPMRFDVVVNDQLFYVRAESQAERDLWVKALRDTKASLVDSGATSMHRHPSTLSLASYASGHSAHAAGHISRKAFKQKLAELVIMQNSLKDHASRLQSQLSLLERQELGGTAPSGRSTMNRLSNGHVMMPNDNTSQDSNSLHVPSSDNDSLQSVDVEVRVQDADDYHRGGSVEDLDDDDEEQACELVNLAALRQDTIVFKASVVGVVTLMDELLTNASKREDVYKNKYQREKQLRQSLEAELAEYRADKASMRYGPDYVEGPHSALKDDEFFDALELGLDQLEAEEEEKRKQQELRARTKSIRSIEVNNPYAKLVEEQIQHSLMLAQEPIGDVWVLAHKEGEMRVYRRDGEEKGISTDRLKAFHQIHGVTAQELCRYFFDPQYKLEWENTVEKFDTLEEIDANTNVQHMLHKRVWPAAQRDSCFVSHFKQLDDKRFAVENVSVEHELAPMNKYVRLTLGVLLLGETVVHCNGPPQSRKDVTCQVTYLAHVHPGGWAPPSVVRAVSQREYPKFLRNLEKHCLKHYQDKPLGIETDV
eukprot:TRINITY_DN11537_c0_g1_i3.p1 TRINITY_DN11537_c0_g1~~TRINITY_DN11537_c0_g1_i3.p1  ORF type:complete len:696 (+),score=164.81 TRINITY_DN11537_c0_g1_i3:88-2175(+)